MGHIPDFRNLYQKSLIPMGKHDKESYTAQTLDEAAGEAAKWMTAYIWHEDDATTGWLVMVYPARQNGSFVGFSPYYTSEAPTTFDQARSVMRTVELNIFADTLSDLNMSGSK